MLSQFRYRCKGEDGGWCGRVKLRGRREWREWRFDDTVTTTVREREGAGTHEEDDE